MARDTWFHDRRKAHAKELTERIVRRMRDESEAIGARFAVAYLPRAKALGSTNEIGYKPLRAFCEAHADIPCVSPLRRIERGLAGEDAVSHFRCHFSPTVNGIIADEIADFLRAESPELFGAPGSGRG